MTIDTDKARAGETSPNHVVLKMLLVSTALAAAAMAVVAMVH